MIFTAIHRLYSKKIKHLGEAAYDKADIALSAITIQQSR